VRGSRGRGGGGGEQVGIEEICKKLYTYGLRSGTLTRGEGRGGRVGGSCTPGCCRQSDRSGATTTVFLREGVTSEQEAKRAFISKRARAFPASRGALRRQRGRDPFISAGLLDAADVRTKVPALCGKGWRSFFPLGRSSAGQKIDR